MQSRDRQQLIEYFVYFMPDPILAAFLCRIHQTISNSYNLINRRGWADEGNRPDTKYHRPSVLLDDIEKPLLQIWVTTWAGPGPVSGNRMTNSSPPTRAITSTARLLCFMGAALGTPQVTSHVSHHLSFVARTPPPDRVGLDVLIEQLIRIEIRAVAGQENEANLPPMACHPLFDAMGRVDRMLVNDEKDFAARPRSHGIERPCRGHQCKKLTRRVPFQLVAANCREVCGRCVSFTEASLFRRR
jgi:hypothetical protein